MSPRTYSCCMQSRTLARLWRQNVPSRPCVALMYRLWHGKLLTVKPKAHMVAKVRNPHSTVQELIHVSNPAFHLPENHSSVCHRGGQNSSLHLRQHQETRIPSRQLPRSNFALCSRLYEYSYSIRHPAAPKTFKSAEG